MAHRRRYFGVATHKTALFVEARLSLSEKHCSGALTVPLNKDVCLTIRKGVTENEGDGVSDQKTELLAIHFLAEQSQWRVI